MNSIWKPLKGPLNDWPLTFCDLQTVDFDQDMTATDDLYIEGANEGFGVHYNP